jgi:thioredoxin reductase (NADPH)
MAVGGNASGEGESQGKVYDCLVVGGGPAGLSAALYLGRLRRSVLVIDDEHGRSTWHQVNRNYLGFPNGVHATALRGLGEKQAAEYGVEFLNGRGTDASSSGMGRDKRFRIDSTAGSATGRTVIFATGVTDRFPEFEGSVECIGKSMFWCIICDGYESIDKRVVVLGHNDRAAALALQLLNFTDRVALVAGEDSLDISDERLNALRAHGVNVYDCGCEVYTCETVGELNSLQLGDGTVIPLDRLFVAQWIEPNTQLAKQLGVKLDQHGYIINDAEQLTNVPGVYAAGDVTRLFNHQVTSAVHEGGMAAAAANYYLYEDWQKE